MNRKLLLAATLGFFITVAGYTQTQPVHSVTVPIYRVTVVDRTVAAVDYQYRTGPTNIDFRGTVLLPMAHGTATVESKTGRTEIGARFDGLAAPTCFGREYLTYVLWAITPDGHPRNLGEILPGSSDKAKLVVTTDLQAFGLIVTAEPHAAVRVPSDVVVLENQPRPDTIGNVEPIKAKYELLPRGQYTFNVEDAQAAANAGGVMLSRDQYQSVVELYEANNAVQMAQASPAVQYAPDTLSKAWDLLSQAYAAFYNKAGVTAVVTLARQAAQTAEDARTVAMKRSHDDELAQAKQQAAQAEAMKAQAEAAAQTARTQADAARALLEQERAARQQAEASAAAAYNAANTAASQPPPPPAPAPVVYDQEPQKRELRMKLLGQLNAELSVRDTPRGLLLTVRDADFRGTHLTPSMYAKLAHVASVLAAYPGLNVEVDGHERYSTERAEAVRAILVGDGVLPAAVTARGWGDSRPLTTNATAAGREQNCRVEIVISGSPIGDMPYWAQTYRLLVKR